MVHHVPCWKQESSANQSEKLSKQKKREKETKAPFLKKNGWILHDFYANWIAFYRDPIKLSVPKEI